MVGVHRRPWRGNLFELLDVLVPPRPLSPPESTLYGVRIGVEFGRALNSGRKCVDLASRHYQYACRTSFSADWNPGAA
jgi:hypothetical protein